jgi:hypothetical protein
MAKKGGGDDGWAFLGLLLAAGGLYYLLAGRGEENDAALIPNTLEGRIDFLIEALNKQFGKRWVDKGLDVLKSQLEQRLPPLMVALVSVVYAVEQASRFRAMSGYDKKQAALQMALAG